MLVRLDQGGLIAVGCGERDEAASQAERAGCPPVAGGRRVRRVAALLLPPSLGVPDVGQRRVARLCLEAVGPQQAVDDAGSLQQIYSGHQAPARGGSARGRVARAPCGAGPGGGVMSADRQEGKRPTLSWQGGAATKKVPIQAQKPPNKPHQTRERRAPGPKKPK